MLVLQSLILRKDKMDPDKIEVGEPVDFDCHYDLEGYLMEKEGEPRCTGFPYQDDSEKHENCISCEYYVNYGGDVTQDDR